MREQYSRQFAQLEELEREGKVPHGAAAQFLGGMECLDFKVDLEVKDRLIEWPLLGKRAESYENPAAPEVSALWDERGLPIESGML